MIYFITNCTLHLSYYRENIEKDIKVLEDTEKTKSFFKNYLLENDINLFGFDVESNGLDAWKNSTILKILGDEDNQFVFHSAYCDFSWYYKECYNCDLVLLGHNIKFDIKFGLTEDKLLYKKVVDTMITEQRLFMKSGLSNSLENLAIRYLDVYPHAMDKSIRIDFIGASTSMKIFPRHLRYAAGDVSNLFPIHRKQWSKVHQYKMTFLLESIEFPLIHIIAKAEVTGFKFNLDKWIEIYEDNIKKKFELELKLDKEVRRLRDLKFGNPEVNGISYIPEKRLFMIGGKWDNQRKKTIANKIFNNDNTTNVLDLFGNKMSKATYTGLKKKVKLNPNNINYDSDTEIIEIFGRLDEVIPTKNNTYVVPVFTKTNKVDRTIYSYTTQEGALLEYLQEFPNSIMKDFIELLLKHRGYSTASNNFGINFKEKINPYTGNIHTVFRQCAAATGRFQSGGGTKEPDKPNFQNIPSKADYAKAMRNCFIAKEGYSIGTHDLSGAELIIMCSLSQDMKLLKISQKDIHSYVAQGSWRLIYAVRAANLIKAYQSKKARIASYFDQAKVDLINKYINNSREFIVNKTKKKLRTAFKPMTFGTIYGMYASKAGKTLNISKDEGQLVIDFIKREFPDVFRMVEEASNFARQKGYVILNTRTYSRAWFPNIIRVLKNQVSEKDVWKFISKEKSEARNIKIQGTQADMVKEMTVELQNWIDENGYTDEITILSWVHDEIVDEHPQYLDGVSEEHQQWLNEGNYLEYKGEKYCSFPRVKQQIMRDTANLYLENVQMDADYDVEPFWTK